MVTISTQEPLAVAAVEAIHTGDIEALQRLLAEHPDLATARLGDQDRADDAGMTRSLRHVVRLATSRTARQPWRSATTIPSHTQGRRDIAESKSLRSRPPAHDRSARRTNTRPAKAEVITSASTP